MTESKVKLKKIDLKVFNDRDDIQALVDSLLADIYRLEVNNEKLQSRINGIIKVVIKGEDK